MLHSERPGVRGLEELFGVEVLGPNTLLYILVSRDYIGTHRAKSYTMLYN